MNEKSEISRRGAFSLLGLGVALALAAPTAMLVASDAEAETAGMERRQERRAGRRERREARRTARHQRREARRGGTPTTTGTKQ
jgi:type II secretory pathway pseudopilin PulG